MEAIGKDFEALMRNEMYELVLTPKHRKIINNRRVFAIKIKPDTTLEVYKSILVAKGFLQTEEIDYNERFNPIMKHTKIRAMLTMKLSKGWIISQLDVNNSFLNVDLEEEVYMYQPEDFFNQTFMRAE